MKKKGLVTIMTHYSTVEKAVELANNVLEASGIMMGNDTLRSRVFSWYNHTDVTDPEILAACAIFGYYDSDYTYDDMLKDRDFWFFS